MSEDNSKIISDTISQLEFNHKNLVDYLRRSPNDPLYSTFAWSYIIRFV